MLDSQAHNPDTYKIGGCHIAIFKYEYHLNNQNYLNNGALIQSQRTIFLSTCQPPYHYVLKRWFFEAISLHFSCKK